MERRKFIKQSLSGLPIIFLSPTILASSCSEEEDKKSNGKKVIVVGAGISGLAAAKN
jgi:ribulose 1,5-bisphosphate synthetase/thiazole synthase